MRIQSLFKLCIVMLSCCFVRDKISKFLLLVLDCFLMLLLVSCAGEKEMLGMSSKKWSQIDETKREELLANYSKIQNLQKKQIAKSSSRLNVKVYGGTVLMQPDLVDRKYKPLTFTLLDGTCHDTKIEDALHDEGKSTSLIACYLDNILYIDPTRYDLDKPFGTVTLYSSPFWEDGFSYHNVSTYGYAKLKNSTIEIKMVN